MPVYRRLYFYCASFICLEIVAWGLIRLLSLFLVVPWRGLANRPFALALSFIILGLPLFLFHWTLAQRHAYKDSLERSSHIRAFFLFGTLSVSGIAASLNLLAYLQRAFLKGFRLDSELALIGGTQRAGDYLAIILVQCLIAAYFGWVLLADWRSYQPEPPEGAGNPAARAVVYGTAYFDAARLFRYLFLFYGLILSAGGVQQLLESLLKVGSPTSRVSVANGLGLLIVGAPILIGFQLWVRRTLNKPEERSSNLRLAALYILSLTGLAGLLVAGRQTLEILLHAGLVDRAFNINLLHEIASPFAWTLFFGAICILNRPGLIAQTPSPQDQPRRARLRRLYFYILASVGLIAIAAGLQVGLPALLTILLEKQKVGDASLWSHLAQGLSALLAGLPMWFLAWQHIMQKVTLESESGEYARRSAIRKSYLFTINALSIAGILFACGKIIFDWVSIRTGSSSGQLLPQSIQMLVALFICGLLSTYHLLVFRSDNHRAFKILSRRHAQFPVLVLTPQDQAFAETIVDALQDQAPSLPVAVHPISQGAPDTNLTLARAVILPAEVMAKPPEAIRLWLQGYKGTRLVVPTPAPDWLWVSGEEGLPSLAKQTARMVRCLAEGEPLKAF